MNSWAAALHFNHSYPCLNIGPLNRVSSKEEAKDHFAVLRLGETHVNRQPELEPAARTPRPAETTITGYVFTGLRLMKPQHRAVG